MDELWCPFCDSEDVVLKPVMSLYYCRDCGGYFEEDDDPLPSVQRIKRQDEDD